MNIKEKALLLSKWYAELAKNDNGYMTRLIDPSKPNGNDWDEPPAGYFEADSPNLESNLDNFNVNLPKLEMQKIDMSGLVDSDIDCEFRTNYEEEIGDSDIWEEISPLFAFNAYNYIARFEDSFKECRVRENYWHHWSGDDNCPLPEGLVIIIAFRGGDDRQNENNYINIKWHHEYRYDDIIAFKVIGTAEGWEY